MKFSLAGLFLFVFVGLTIADITRIHIYVSTPMNWNDARAYCKILYEDLSTITSEMENLRLIKAGGYFQRAWIGLNRIDSGNWVWADGQLFNNWRKFWSLYQNKDSCVYATQDGWDADLCSIEHPFFCYDTYRPGLITTDMTWEDALMFCREHYIDLASAAQTYQLQLLQKSLRNSTTASVWMDLRFLAGEWQWVSRTFREIPYEGSLESCPPDPYRCGAYNISTAQMENRNCEEMLNFVCY